MPVNRPRFQTDIRSRKWRRESPDATQFRLSGLTVIMAGSVHGCSALELTVGAGLRFCMPADFLPVDIATNSLTTASDALSAIGL